MTNLLSANNDFGIVSKMETFYQTICYLILYNSDNINICLIAMNL